LSWRQQPALLMCLIWLALEAAIYIIGYGEFGGRERIIAMPLMVLLFIGTIFSTLASANGCINDASRAWFSMARDRYLPQWFGAVHPKYRTPYRSIVFLVPVAVVFAYYAPLDQVITFSILSGLLGYTFMTFNVIMFVCSLSSFNLSIWCAAKVALSHAR